MLVSITAVIVDAFALEFDRRIYRFSDLSFGNTLIFGPSFSHKRPAFLNDRFFLCLRQFSRRNQPSNKLAAMNQIDWLTDLSEFVDEVRHRLADSLGYVKGFRCHIVKLPFGPPF